LRCPAHLVAGLGEHYLPVNFTGWRYFELIESEGERYEDYEWPYGHPYAIYRESVDFGHLESVSLWYNSLPAKGSACCYLSPIKALPLVKATLSNPAVTIGGETIIFPVELESGCYVEFRSMSDCKLYGPDGGVIREVEPEGEAPTLSPGHNRAKFECLVTPAEVRGRAHVTVVSRGDPLK